jgi:maltose/moltooligosaccharide transporter
MSANAASVSTAPDHAPTAASAKPRLGFPQIFNMNFGFLGIQFGWGLQLANMSAIYAKLGAKPEEIPILWLAGPMTGLLIQPIVGAMSDRTWNKLGRRRPYFLTGAILASIALFFMPSSPALWAAATLLWILDASINISMEPFRAFVTDKLPPEQSTVGFVTQSFFIGVGAAIANSLPSIFTAMGVTGKAANGVPLTVEYSFKLGALVFLAAVIWTVLTSKEYPPADMAAFEREKSKHNPFHIQPKLLLGGAAIGAFFGASRGALVDGHLTPWHLLAGAGLGAIIGFALSGPEVSSALRDMPKVMKQLAVVQFFSWLGLFCMWMFFGLATAQQLFNATDPGTPEFDKGTAFGGETFAIYSIVCFLVAFLLPPLAKSLGRKVVHAVALVCGAIGLLATGFIHDPTMWKLTMVGVGVAWASILAMPYAMLGRVLPANRIGVYMGIFNFFIVIPEILASLTLQPIVGKLFNNEPVKVVMLGGASMICAAIATLFVEERA